jgi:3-hydroxyisobutyrate dehydrogenase-like beta-hydroxyacid dehydrogenase
MAKVSFIGLGTMGWPMASHLAKAGHTVTVFNRTASKAQKWAAENGGSAAATPCDAAVDSDFVFTCVGNDDDLRQVTTGPDGAFYGMKKDAVLVDHTTVSATVVRELYAEAKKRELNFLDAPVSGGQAGAEKGSLTLMAGGDEEIFRRTEPVMQAYATTLQFMGPSGSGQLTKMVNQICIAGIVESLSEALAFGLAAKLDMQKVLAAIAGGAAGSWQMANRSQTMIEDKFDFGFAVDWMRKDFGICMDEAKRLGVSLPVCALVDQLYAEVQKMGLGRQDTSTLIKRLRRN